MSLLSRIQSLQRLAMSPRWIVRAPATYLEALFYSSLALCIASLTGPTTMGFFGLFLASVSLSGRFDELLTENHQNIYEHKTGPKVANGTTAVALLAMFLGLCTTFLVVALWFTSADEAGLLDFVMKTTGTASGDLTNRDFSQLSAMLRHNFSVMLVIAILCFFYRSLGALLVLGWNACVWVFVLVTLAQNSLASSALGAVHFSVVALAGVTPHILLEAAAYILVALAAIFYSKAVSKYELSNPVVLEVQLVCTKMVLIASAILVCAGLVEAHYAPWALGFLG